MENRNVILMDMNPSDENLKSLGIKHIGIYIGRDDWRMGEKLINNLLPRDKIQNYTKQDFLDSVDTVYRLPHLTLSRDKLSIFAEECDFKITRKRDIADIIVIGEQTIKKMVQNSYSTSIDFKTFKSCYNVGKEWKKLTSEDQNCMHKNVKLIEDLYGDDCEISFQQSYYYSSNGYGEKLDTYRSYLKSNNGQQTGYMYYYPENSYENMNFVKNNIDKVIFDSDLNLLCTGDSICITKKDFKSIYTMVNSNDKENLSVGMTMMANCNVEKSKTYLALLFAFCSENMKNSKVWNQVNFKYLRKEFDYYNNITLSSWGHAYSHLIKHMIKDNCLTHWASRIIAAAMYKNVIVNHLQVGGREFPFDLSVEDLQLKPEYKDSLIKLE